MSSGQGPRPRRPRLGLRSEVLILLPAALVLLVVLSTFTLASYRSALTRLTEERRDEAARLARSAAAALAADPGGPGPGLAKLQPLAPGARGIAVLDPAGRLLAAAGEPPANPLAAAGGRPVTQPFGAGPDERLPDAVVGFAPLPGGGAVRVELPAATLAGQRRAIGILTAVVLAVNGALLVLVVFFLRHLLAPYETLLLRARQVGELDGATGGEDEVDLLLGTFERALAALAARTPQEAGEDDIAALERTLSASLQSGLLLLDREGRVLALNEMGAALLGTATPPPSPGTPLADLLAGQPELQGLLASAIAEESEVNRQECTLSGSAITLGLTVHPLRRQADRTVRGYLVLFADLTGVRRKAEESRLAESLAQLGEMAAGVAHELRNSLATLSGYLTLLERGPAADTAAGYLGEIRHETDQLQRVLNDFLAFARPGTARPEELSLGRLLRRAAADPALSGLAVDLAGDLDSIHLKGDPQLLERAFGNLLRNAAEAERGAGREGPVEVRVRRGEDFVELTIADRGRGVPPELKGRLFHPFATGRPGGVGLGLAVAQRVVNLHGGRIRLEDRPGGGTEARIFFPAELLVEQSRYAK
ncbi:MAG: two-component system, NtrC family, sensor histidine kinase PilS [Acidobacteriota bacterium]|nr:two-component system, NtrC family, sensor histidine kinase PilS [Acidobacteriota bacterium]